MHTSCVGYQRYKIGEKWSTAMATLPYLALGKLGNFDRVGLLDPLELKEALQTRIRACMHRAQHRIASTNQHTISMGTKCFG